MTEETMMTDEEVKAAAATLVRLVGQVYRDGDYIVFAIRGHYEIHLRTCNTPSKIAVWASHLSDKNWMTLEALQRFVAIACEAHGFEGPEMG